MNETRVELLQHRVCHQRNAPELGLERHRHQEAQRFSATGAKNTLAMTVHHLAETTRRRVPTLTLAGVEADSATLSQNGYTTPHHTTPHHTTPHHTTPNHTTPEPAH